jgi:hypothetical protein
MSLMNGLALAKHSRSSPVVPPRLSRPGVMNPYPYPHQGGYDTGAYGYPQYGYPQTVSVQPLRRSLSMLKNRVTLE